MECIYNGLWWAAPTHVDVCHLPTVPQSTSLSKINANDLVCVLNHPEIHTSFTGNDIYHQDLYLLHASRKVEIDYYRQSALNKSDLIQNHQSTDKASAGFLSFDQHLAHEDDDFLAKERTSYFVISFLFLYTNCWLLITKIKFRCRLMTRQIIDQYSTWRYISKVHACQIRISSVSRNVMLPVIMMSLPNANASSIARNVYQMHSAD